MNSLKKLFVALSLTCMLAIAAFAGETDTPPCVPSENTPTCSSAPVTSTDSVTQGDTQTPPDPELVSATTILEDTLMVLLLF